MKKKAKNRFRKSAAYQRGYKAGYRAASRKAKKEAEELEFRYSIM